MIRSIKQRVHFVGLLPLALLAVALVVLNGVVRLTEAMRDLRNTQSVTAKLLQASALDALIVGNIASFDKAAANVVMTSPSVDCITLKDKYHREVSRAGECTDVWLTDDAFPAIAPTGDLSDLDDGLGTGNAVGEIRVSMSKEGLIKKRREVMLQLALSLVLIGGVLVVVGRLLRSRLIEPVERIGSAMASIGRRDYSVRVSVAGDDELARLATAINDTLTTIAAYARELEDRRREADRALHDADEANLARNGLVRSLTEDLQEPMNQMYAELTAIAIANQDSALRERIKHVMVSLEEAQRNFNDLVEVTAGVERSRARHTAQDLSEFVTDVQRELGSLVEAGGPQVDVQIGALPWPTGSLQQTGLFIDLDGRRTTKALVYLTRLVGRRSNRSEVLLRMDFLRISSDTLRVLMHVTVLNDAASRPVTLPLLDGPTQSGMAPPSALGWTDREKRIMEYLLRAADVTPIYSLSLTGTVSVLLEANCSLQIEPGARSVETDWVFATHPIATTVVSNDLSLMRLTTRGELSNHELTLLSLSDALAKPAELLTQDVLLIDISNDVADAFDVLTCLKAEGRRLPTLIAVCPAGRIDDELGNRLFDLGFVGVVQKPLQYSRLLKIIQASLHEPLSASSGKI